MLPRESVARATIVVLPVFDGVQANDQRRQAYGSCRGSSVASCHVAPSSSLTSTLLMSGAPLNAKPAMLTAFPTRALFGAVVMFDLTNRSVTGVISSGLNATPGAP